MRSILHLTYVLFFTLSLVAQEVQVPTDTIELAAPFAVTINLATEPGYRYQLAPFEPWTKFTQILDTTLEQRTHF